jgi:putative phage-type endonuclease
MERERTVGRLGSSDGDTFCIIGDWADGSPEWLAARHEGIGASDTPSILDVPGAYKTKLQIWTEKVNKEAQDTENDRLLEILEFGHKMEPIIAGTLEERTGMKVVPEKRTLGHATHPFIRANLDGWIEMDGVMVPAEFKNVNEFMGSRWEEEPPLVFNVQLQHQMYVVGAERGVLAAVIGGNRFVYAIIERNEKFQEQMVRALLNFWDDVENNNMPSGVAEDIDLLKNLFETESAKETVLPDEARDWAAAIEEAKDAIKKWTKIQKDAEAKIWQALGDAGVGELPGGGGFKVISVDKEPYTVAASSYKYLKQIKVKE